MVPSFPEYRAKVEGDPPLFVDMLAKTPSSSFREDKEEAEEGVDDEDVPAELTRNVVVGREQSFYHQDILLWGGD